MLSCYSYGDSPNNSDVYYSLQLWLKLGCVSYVYYNNSVYSRYYYGYYSCAGYWLHLQLCIQLSYTYVYNLQQSNC